MKATAAVFLTVLGTVLGSAQQQPTREQQIAAALLPLPEAYRAGATVVAYGPDNKSTTLRPGSSNVICETDRPGDDGFAVSCYEESVFKLNSRRRELRRELGITGRGNTQGEKKVDEMLENEIQAGKLKLPKQPSIGFRMAGPASGFDWATNQASKEIERWEMIIIPHVTGKALSLPTEPAGTMPWVMWEGTPLAHIMVQHRASNVH